MRVLALLVLSATAVGCRFSPPNPDAAGYERPWSPLPPACKVTRPGLPAGRAGVVPASAVEPRPTVVPAVGQVPAPSTPASGDSRGAAVPVLPPPGQALTVADLENLAAASNPTIVAAEALIRQQEGILRQETLYPNPTAGYLRSDPDQPNQSATQGVFLSQDFVTAGKLRLAGAAGREEVKWRHWQLAAQRGRVLNDVRIRYYEVLGAQQTVLASEELERLAAEGVRVSEELVKAKQAARPDVLQAEMQLHAVRTALQDAKYRHQAAWTQLANVVGVPDLPPAALADDLEKDIPGFEWEPTLQRLLAASPVLKAQEAQIRAAGWDLDLARAGAIPNVNVQVVVQRDHVQKYTSVSPLVVHCS